MKEQTKQYVIIEQCWMSGTIPHNESDNLDELMDIKDELEYENPSSEYYIWDRINKIKY